VTRTPLWLLLAPLCALGCNAILGIERLPSEAPADAAVSGNQQDDQDEQDDQRDPDGPATNAGQGGGRVTARAGEGGRRTAPTDEAGPGGTATGTAGAAAGGAGAAGRSSQPNTAGRASPIAGAPAQAGSSATAGSGADTPIAGAAGDAAPAQLTPVRGRVIDYFRHGIANANVRIGEQTTRSDETGHFSIDAVPAVYDVTVSIAASINNLATQLALQAQGLTRRDPTLQIERALPEQSAPVSVTIDQVTFPLSTTQRLITSWTSPDGVYNHDQTSQSVSTSITWYGPMTSAGIAHALLYETSGTPALPTAYTAHSGLPITLRASPDVVPIPFSLAPQSIESGNVSGTIVGPNQNRAVRAVLRFADATALELLSDFRAADSFSYLVPKLPDTSVALSAEDRANGRAQGITAAIIDDVAPGKTVALTLPPVPTLIAPAANKAEVDGTTVFQWNGDARVFLMCAESTFNYDRVCVLTSNETALLPVMPASDFVPAANTGFIWYVETHDYYASVDEAAGEAGYLSAYSYGRIVGPKRGHGAYTRSAERLFTTRP